MNAFLIVSYTNWNTEEKDQTNLPNPIIPITISPKIPGDVLPNGIPAYRATINQAAAFAWQEFIALNWAAQPGFRDSANAAIAFGNDHGTVPLVWHTFRHKVEIYPGNSKVPYGYNPSKLDYGYNTASPGYFYNPDSTGTIDGQVAPAGKTPDNYTPWVNLDEINEIGVATMFTGVSDSTKYPGQQILFLAKANKAEYTYIAKNKWYGGTSVASNGLATAKANTAAYIKANGNTPVPGASNSLVSLPYGTIEIKSAWRRLTPAEQQSGRFYSTTVRYYKQNGTTKKPNYIDEVFGMVALHIIHKTPTAPYFVFATFEQTDNILTANGSPVEDADGNIIANQNLNPLNPNFKVTNATPTTPQMFSPMTANSIPGKSLYYENTVGQKLPEGKVTINRRLHPIPPQIISANRTAHAAITQYNRSKGVVRSPWSYYKLINVQYKPITKTPGVNYRGSDSSNYYLANSVVESDYILQQFSGQFSPLKNGGFTITDFSGPLPTDTTFNSYYNGKYLMGGCMGCHGNATNKGGDYSFILGNTVRDPEFVPAPGQPSINLNSNKSKQLREILGIR